MRQARSAWAAAGFLVMAACGSTDHGFTIGSPAAASSPAPAQAPASPTSSLHQPPFFVPPPDFASSARISSSPPAELGSCAVPYSNISEADGGFIAYPGGQRQSDPSSAVALPGNTPGQVGVNIGLAFDRVVQRWVPVPLDWVAPRGLTYAYTDTSGRIRAVTVLTGSSGDVTVDGGWELIATADDGVYAVKATTPGAWFVAFGGEPRQLVYSGTWERYSGGALWGVDSSRNLVQHDVVTGAETVWGPVSSYSDIVGFAASGEPLVVTGGVLVMLHLTGTPTIVWPGNGDLGEGGRAYADAQGIWFEVDGSRVAEPGTGVYRWTPDKGAQLIAAEVVHVMGPCA